MLQIEDVVRDRGSRYAVSGGPVQGRAGAEAFLAELKRTKKYAKATHNTWACVFSDAGPVKNDDGEAGAGAGPDATPGRQRPRTAGLAGTG